jgi:drug/metabolite transporter (DMT)-like permease
MPRFPIPPAALAVVGLEAGFVVAWSSGFIGVRLAQDAGDGWALLAWRFALVGGGLAAVAAVTGRFRLPAADVARAAVVGLLAQGVYLLGVFGAMGLGVPAAPTALIAALQPLVVATLAGRLIGERTVPRQWAGLSLGLVGVGLAVADDLGSGGAAAPAAAYLLPVLSVAGLTAATLLQRRWAPRPLLPDLAVQFGASAVLFAGVALAAGLALAIATTPAALGAIAWLAVLSTLGGYGFLWAVVARRGATRAASLVYLTPPVTALWAWAQFGEAVGVGALAGLGVALVGVVLAGGGAAVTAARTPRPSRSGAPCAG